MAAPLRPRGVAASRTLHADTVRRLSWAPLWWYDATPSGRILSRYTSDVGVIDTQLAPESTEFKKTHKEVPRLSPLLGRALLSSVAGILSGTTRSFN